MQNPKEIQAAINELRIPAVPPGKHAVIAGQVTAHGRLIQEAALKSATAGLTMTETAEMLGIARSTILHLRQVDQAFDSALERAQFAGSSLALEDLKLLPYNTSDPRMAKLRMDAISRWLELRWPDRYGRRVNMTVQHVDLRGALDEARARARQVIDVQAEKVQRLTDGQSVEDLL